MNVEITALADADLEEIYLRIRKDSSIARMLLSFPERSCLPAIT